MIPFRIFFFLYVNSSHEKRDLRKALQEIGCQWKIGQVAYNPHALHRSEIVALRISKLTEMELIFQEIFGFSFLWKDIANQLVFQIIVDWYYEYIRFFSLVITSFQDVTTYQFSYFTFWNKWS